MATIQEQLSEEQRRALQAKSVQGPPAPPLEPTTRQGPAVTHQEPVVTRQGPTTHTGPGAGIPQVDPDTAEALKALVRAKAEAAGVGSEQEAEALALSVQRRAAVSYTHLTLPTILLV